MNPSLSRVVRSGGCCMQDGDGLAALLVPVHETKGSVWGGANLNLPTGGAANGIPKTIYLIIIVQCIISP